MEQGMGRRPLAALAAAGLIAARPGWAQSAEGYPSRPVRIVLPVAPGGATDTIGRVLADELTKKGRGSFFVENRPGAGGNLAY